MANRTVSIDGLGKAIEQELSIYHEDVTRRVDMLSEAAAKELVKETKATAPEGARGSYKKNIASKLTKKTRRGNTYTWHVKAPDFRLTHLLVHGHATRDGGRTRPDPFLKNALDKVLPRYQRDVEEALRNGK